MRMRKKKNLETRIENCKDLFIKLNVNSDKDTRIKCSNKYIELSQLFGNENDIYLEIGCGKGQFACNLADQNPNINIIAIEKCENVLVVAAETALNRNIKNVKFISCGAEYLDRYIKPNTISGIYLNFSCPYPKNKYQNHRLTSERFLNLYKLILKNDAKIFQKTDNMHFFEFSVEQFSKSCFAIDRLILDLHNSDYQGNIMTEYETKFVSQGLPIYYLEALLKEEK